jgi:hypothetical protein
MNHSTRWIVVGAGAALTALFVVLSLVEGLNERVLLFLAVFAAAFAAYVAAVVVLRNGGGGAPSRRFLWFVFLVAAASRAVLIPSTPQMSTDVFRYLWEGRVIVHGFNPFVHAPDAPELQFLQDQYYDDINHKHLTTIYPPVAQAVFALAARVRPDPYLQKLIFVLFDLGVIIMIGALLKMRSLNPAATIVYAWNPLVIFETGHSGHLEPLGIFFLLLGIWLAARGRRFWGFAAVGASFLAKYLAAVFVPYFLAKKRYAAWAGVMAVVVAVGYLPFASAGTGLFSSLRLYMTEWQFNGLVFKLLNLAVGDAQWTRGILTGTVVVVVAYNSLRQMDVVRFGFIVVGTGLLFAPTLYPWYVAWIVPFLCFYRNRAWILFTGLVFLSYWVWELFPVEGQWELPWRVYAAEYVPFYALLIYDAVRTRRQKGVVAS